MQNKNESHDVFGYYRYRDDIIMVVNSGWRKMVSVYPDVEKMQKTLMRSISRGSPRRQCPSWMWSCTKFRHRGAGEWHGDRIGSRLIEKCLLATTRTTLQRFCEHGQKMSYGESILERALEQTVWLRNANLLQNKNTSLCRPNKRR